MPALLADLVATSKKAFQLSSALVRILIETGFKTPSTQNWEYIFPTRPNP
jgi:hypothetical protein